MNQHQPMLVLMRVNSALKNYCASDYCLVSMKTSSLAGLLMVTNTLSNISDPSRSNFLVNTWIVTLIWCTLMSTSSLQICTIFPKFIKWKTIYRKVEQINPKKCSCLLSNSWLNWIYTLNCIVPVVRVLYPYNLYNFILNLCFSFF